MDEPQLKNILNADLPAPDDNARKRAVNLALAAFEAKKTAPKKSFQGFFNRSRLIDRINENPRREKMNKKLVYGGMATAMVVVLAAGVAFQSMTETIGSSGKVGTFESVSDKKTDARMEREVAASVEPSPAQGGNNYALIQDGGIVEKAKEAYRQMAAPAEADGASVGASMPVGAAQNMVAGTLIKDSSISAQIMASPMAPPMVIGMDMPVSQAYQDVGRDKFEEFKKNPVKVVKAEPVSTFSVDVDTASYSFIRRQLNAGILPQKDAVRIEEMVNYFDYHYPVAEDKAEPFKPTVVVTPSPWVSGHKLVHIGIKGYDIPQTTKPHANLVFLIDTSGSMNSPDKLPLVKNSLKMLLDTLNPNDTVAIVTYAGSAGIALEPTKASDKAKIIASLDNLGAGGGTAGSEGIRTAYQLAEASITDYERSRSDSSAASKSVNRVILATDGDFNIGITNPEELKDFIERKRDTGIFLSILGFGQGNLNDQMMQTLAQNGNGVAAYIDTLNEARKVLVQESSSTLFTIAKDVKIQVEFNPATVAEYRLVGYETRALNQEDFNNDAVDAGDIGAGHAVTAIYDITPVGVTPSVDPSRYGTATPATPVQETKADTNFGNEYAFLKIRYKLPDGDTSKLITTPISTADETGKSDVMVQDANWATAVAGFGQLLKGGKSTNTLTYDRVIEEAQAAKGTDEFGYRSEFIQLVRLAKTAATMQTTQP